VGAPRAGSARRVGAKTRGVVSGAFFVLLSSAGRQEGEGWGRWFEMLSSSISVSLKDGLVSSRRDLDLPVMLTSGATS
jgi:hypothetical protein